MAGPFFFYWALDTETTFNQSTMMVEDEEVLSFVIEHTEGNIPTLHLDIKNPRVGLLSHGRRIWIWLSWQDPATGHVWPLFYGRLVGIPTNVLAEACTLQFVAQPLDYLEQKQVIAETLKVFPWYDPVFGSAAQRDDPDWILSGYPSLWHIDRFTVVSVSDLLVGEEGEEIFTADESFYDSVNMTIGQPPLTSVNVDATVAWTQSDFGIVPIGQKNFVTYTGGQIISDWPKPDTSIGGGYSVHSAVAYDRNFLELAWTATYKFKWENHEDTHIEGDAIARDYTATGPEGFPATWFQTLFTYQAAFMDPFNPDFKDITNAWAKHEYMGFGIFDVVGNLVLRYEAARQRTERVIFTVQSNLQQVLSFPQSPPLPSEETITISAQNVGELLVNVLDWLSVKGKVVDVGQVVYPNAPTILGGTSYQMATTAGTAGTVQPFFSPVLGQTTTDGTVVWTSLGSNLASATPDWTGNTGVSVGQIIRPLEPLWCPWQDLVPMPRLVGASVSYGEFVQGAGCLQVCILPGTTGLTIPGFSGSYGGITQDGSAQWFCCGSYIPDGSVYFVATQAGVTAETTPPQWNPTLDATFTDGSVVWRSLGEAGKFLNLPIGDLSRSNYFPQARGLQSLEYLIGLARAKLIKRARCVTIKFDCTFERALTLSCRKNAILYDERIPGGSALGKITGYTIACTGDEGVLGGSITMECAVGYGGHAASDAGVGVYALDGYMLPGYQQMVGQITVHEAGDIGYTPPVAGVVDDGLIFPLTASQIIVRDVQVGTIASQLVGITQIAALKAQIAQLSYLSGVTFGDVSIAYESKIAALSRINADQFLLQHEFWWDFELKPVNNGPFNAEYPVLTTQLQIPMGINLEAPSNP